MDDLQKLTLAVQQLQNLPQAVQFYNALKDKECNPEEQKMLDQAEELVNFAQTVIPKESLDTVVEKQKELLALRKQEAQDAIASIDSELSKLEPNESK